MLLSAKHARQTLTVLAARLYELYLLIWILALIRPVGELVRERERKKNYRKLTTVVVSESTPGCRETDQERQLCNIMTDDAVSGAAGLHRLRTPARKHLRPNEMLLLCKLLQELSKRSTEIF